MAEAEFSKRAFKVLQSLDTITKARIIAGIEKIPEGDIKPLVGQPGRYRLRIGDWRILFQYLDDTKQKVLVGYISPRGDAYK